MKYEIKPVILDEREVRKLNEYGENLNWLNKI